MGTPDHAIACIGCGALVPDIEGPTFRYPDAASPGCWAIFGEILANEYGTFNYPDVQRLTIDAYAAQHPGRVTPQTRQSVTVHLMSLCCVLERRYPMVRATEMIGHAISRYKGRFEWLTPPGSRGAVTVLDVVGATNLCTHIGRVERWARSVWMAWEEHHTKIHPWIDQLQP
jgi:hypothetical protein